MLRTIAFILLSSCSTVTFASTTSCAEQRSDIASKLDTAEADGDSYEISRLQLAQEKVNTYCTDDRQYQRASRDVANKKRKVAEIEEDIQEAQRDYNEAAEDANVRKIEKYQRKIAEKKRKLEEAKEEEKNAEADLAAFAN
ncbi:DUF1090 family protein [Erwinia sp. P6884]|uniref:DUF1090 family protein n=1 Tax=Erwinia sp. P6884 TaxID=3141450 RepID=UPI00318D315F